MGAYHWLKALHLIALISWMAGMLYLPRLYVYHTRAIPGGEADKMLQVMERRLLRIIMNPAMILTWIFGFALAINIHAFDVQANGSWLHCQAVFSVGYVGNSWISGQMPQRFRARGKNTKSEKFFRIMNEVPAVLMIGIVLLVVLKPF